MMSFFRSCQDYFYKPYRGHRAPQDCNMERSKATCPLLKHYRVHIRKTEEAKFQMAVKRSHHRDIVRTTEAYRNRRWFIRMSDTMELIIQRVKIEGFRYQSGDFDLIGPMHRTYVIWLAMLEVVCSLVLHADHRDYWALSDEDIEQLRFPLSRWARTHIIKLKVSGGEVLVKTRF